MKKKTVAIIGLGLMGGSLALALRKRGRGVRVIGVSRSRAKIRQAVRRKIIHEGTTSLARGVETADLIVVATPVGTIASTVRKIDRWAPVGAVVTDAGSTKLDIARAVGRQPLKRVRYVGSHPMCGSHHQGLSFVNAGIYRGANVFVMEPPGGSARARSRVARLWRSVGARVWFVSAAAHDRISAEVSQIPHLVAALLVHTVPKRAFRYLGTGFRDTTRIAQGDPHLWLDIVLSNRKPLVKGLGRFRSLVLKLERAIRKKDSRTVLRLLTQARNARRRLNTTEQ